MKRAVLALVFACGGAQPSVTLPPARSAEPRVPEAVVRPDPLPAGACGFDGSISQGCTRDARWAVVAAFAQDEAEATKALAVARAANVVAGYPFAMHTEELPPADFREGIAIVLGLFEKEADARDEARALHATAVELASWENYRAKFPSFDDHHAVVEMLEDAPAFDKTAVLALETGMRGPLSQDVERRAAFARDHASVCRVRRGDVFVAIERDVAELSYGWAPVRCAGKEAVVLERSTRFKAVVKHDDPPTIWQIVQAQCTPMMESRPFGVPAGPLGKTHVDDDCY